MSAFFQGLSKGRGNATALREAQLALIADRRARLKAAHPMFWAAFGLTGYPGASWRDEALAEIGSPGLPPIPGVLSDSPEPARTVSPVTGLPEGGQPLGRFGDGRPPAGGRWRFGPVVVAAREPEGLVNPPTRSGRPAQVRGTVRVMVQTPGRFQAIRRRGDGMSRRSLNADSSPTRPDDLSDWQAFCTAYYDPIVGVFRFLRGAEGDADDLAHSFLLKAADGRFLASFRNFQGREVAGGRRARFRSYLYKSLQNHALDERRRRAVRPKEQALGLGEAAELASTADRPLEPDALYALHVLHQAVQALRTHSERSGKAHLWVVFEETFLVDEIRGRRRKTRAELLEAIGRDDFQALDNCLTTAKRSFRRLALEVILGWPGEDDPSDRFAEWMEILRRCNASQFDLLRLAYRVAPHLGDADHARSTSMVIRERWDAGAGPGAGEAISDEELGILLGFWLEMPLTRWLEPADWPALRPILGRPALPGGSPRRPGRRERPPCLLTFFDPTEGEAERLAGVDLIEVLTGLKSLAKRLHLRDDHAVPVSFSELIYTGVATLAVVRHRTALHTIGSASLAKNLRWFLGRPWLDARLRPSFEAGLADLEAPTDDRT